MTPQIIRAPMGTDDERLYPAGLLLFKYPLKFDCKLPDDLERYSNIGLSVITNNIIKSGLSLKTKITGI